MTERDITICGHGSNTPSLKNLNSYLTMRYGQKMSNGIRKELLAVRRLKVLDTEARRQKFHDLYKSILGRNSYNQDMRQYVYTPYKGRYYSDCSSSGCATYQRCGAEISLLNTAGMLTSDLFVDVDCGIQDGHILWPDQLKVGDALLFAGNLGRPSLRYVGHVEYIYEMPDVPGSGWMKLEGEWYYLENGEAVKDAWKYIDGRWYVFNGSGAMTAGEWFLDSTGLWYYLGEDGAMLSNQWLKHGGDWYYLTADGSMAADAFVPDPRGWCYVDGHGMWDGAYREKVERGPGIHIVNEQYH